VKSSIVVWLVAFELALAGICIAAGSPANRRSHFWLRLVLGCLAVPLVPVAVLAVLVVSGLPEDVGTAVLSVVPLVVIASLMFVPALLYHRSGPSPGQSDENGGGGSGPYRPSSPPTGPGGGLPLPDADQARARARDHNGPRLGDAKPRRPAREPVRAPGPAKR
jgi:hypothetical protein